MPRMLVALCAILALGQPGLGLAQPNPNPAPAPGGPYNVILILMDDVGMDLVRAYEQTYTENEPNPPSPTTPAIDTLAADGIRFTNLWVSPSCTPTRSMIMSGLPAYATGMGTVVNPNKPENVGLDPNLMTLPKLIANDKAVGKWHMGDETQGAHHPSDLGFGDFIGSMYNLVAPAQDGGSTPYIDWREWNLTCSPSPQSTYATAETTGEAIMAIDDFEANATGPWFLYVAYNAPHSPFHCPSTTECSQPGSGETDWCAACDEDLSSASDKVRAMMQALDHGIGQITQKLTDDSLWDDTVVIVLGDNGTDNKASEHPFTPNGTPPSLHRAKNTLYQAGINVPLIIRAPVGPRGDTQNALASGTDLYATIADYMNVSIPGGLDSYSLRGLVDGTATAGQRRFLYAERFLPTFRPENGQIPSDYVALQTNAVLSTYERAIRDDRFKLIEANFTDQPSTYRLYQLYDPNIQPLVLPQDPAVLDDQQIDPTVSAFELVNLANDPNYATELASLQSALDNYPKLPLGELDAFSPTVVRMAEFFSNGELAGVYCSEDDIHVSSAAGTNDVSRTFVEFDVSSLAGEVNVATDLVRVFVDVPVELGGSDAATVVDAVAVAGDASIYDLPTDCDLQFQSITSPVYGSTADWTDGDDGFCSPVTKSIELDGALDDLFAAIDGDGKFSLALKLQSEALPDHIDLFDEVGNVDPAYPNVLLDAFELRVYHRATGGTPPGGPMKAAANAIPGPPGTIRQNTPNPFNPTTTIEYTVEAPSHVALNVYDTSGRRVRTLVDQRQDPGDRHRVSWDGRDDDGRPAPSGVYFYRLTIGDFATSRKMVLLR